MSDLRLRLDAERRRAMMSALSILNLVRFQGDLEEDRAKAVHDLRVLLGIDRDAAPAVTAPIHRATDLHPYRHPSDGVNQC